MIHALIILPVLFKLNIQTPITARYLVHYITSLFLRVLLRSVCTLFCFCLFRERLNAMLKQIAKRQTFLASNWHRLVLTGGSTKYPFNIVLINRLTATAVIVHYLPADCNPSPLQLVAFLLVSNCQAIRSRTIGYFMRQSCKKRR